MLRETIRYLEAKRLVEILPNKGPIVATLSWAQAQQIYNIRQLLEGTAAAACATSHSEAFATALPQALEAISKTMNDTEWAGLLEATTRFYELIFEEARQDIAWGIVQRLNGRISRLRALTIAARNHDLSSMHQNDGDP